MNAVLLLTSILLVTVQLPMWDNNLPYSKTEPQASIHLKYMPTNLHNPYLLHL